MFFPWAFVFKHCDLCLTRPPVASASLPMSAKRQSVPLKLIIDIITLKRMVLFSTFQTLLSFCMIAESSASLLFLHGLQSQLSVEIRRLVQGGQDGGLFYFTESNVGSAVGAQNDLQWPKNPKSHSVNHASCFNVERKSSDI